MARLSRYAAGDEPGSVKPFAMAAPPRGWLKANGAAVSRADYPRLFAAIGTTHGAGDGETTFNLPDLRGEFVRGLDDGRGVDTGRALGSGQGEETKSHSHGASTNSTGSHGHSASSGSNGSHTHGIPYRAGAVFDSSVNPVTGKIGGTYNSTGGGISSAGSHSHSVSVNSNGSHSHTVSVGNSGGAETRPRNVALLYAIKT